MIKATQDSLMPERQIRAFYTEQFIRVYQAYSDEIADTAIKNGTFVSPPFSLTRMTWIKPSFLWMMYRSGWGLKDKGQKRILAVDISHDGFKKIIDQGVISHSSSKDSHLMTVWKEKIRESNVVIQWDPERNIKLEKLNYRTIQIGLRDGAVNNYVNEWVLSISDVTNLAHDIHKLVCSNKIDEALSILPLEKEYKII